MCLPIGDLVQMKAWEVKRVQAIQMSEDGIEIEEIMNRLRVSQRWVYKWIKRAEEGKGINDLFRSGRPAVPAEVVEEIHRELHEGQSMRGVKRQLEAEGKSVSMGSVMNMAHRTGLHARKRRRKPRMSEEQKQRRVDFAEKHGKGRYWTNIVFTDEKVFVCGDRSPWVWVEDWEEPEPMESQKYPPSVMVWGGICKFGVLPLHCVRKGQTLTAEYYQRILAGHLTEPANKWFGKKDNWKLLQDNAPPHTATSTENWFKNQRVRVVPDWPANSPDLNPMENLWNIVADRAATHRPTTREELKSAVKQEWRNMEQTLISKLIQSMPTRMDQVKTNHGGPIKY